MLSIGIAETYLKNKILILFTVLSGSLITAGLTSSLGVELPFADIIGIGVALLLVVLVFFAYGYVDAV